MGLWYGRGVNGYQSNHPRKPAEFDAEALHFHPLRDLHVASRELDTPAIHRLERYRISGPPFDFASQADANSRNTNVCGLRLLSLTSEGHSIFYTFCQYPKRLRIYFADPR